MRHRPVIFGLALSLLIHVTGLWLLIDRSPLVIKPAPPGSEGRVTVFLTPPPANPPAPAQAPPSAGSRPGKTPTPRVAKRKQIQKPSIATIVPRETAPKTAPPVTEPNVASPDPAPSDDMFTQLQAARKRRADAQARERASQAEALSSQQGEAQDRNSSANSVALANIETSLRHANGVRRDDSGGLFQVRRVGLRDAAFVFHGWSANSRRTSDRLVTVEQGAEASIQIAVVKKMIDIIREQKSDTFIWESHRLGRQLTLSARPEDSMELQQFLLREFFSD
jgi:hypothetical protein